MGDEEIVSTAISCLSLRVVGARRFIVLVFPVTGVVKIPLLPLRIKSLEQMFLVSWVYQTKTNKVSVRLVARHLG